MVFKKKGKKKKKGFKEFKYDFGWEKVNWMIFVIISLMFYFYYVLF